MTDQPTTMSRAFPTLDVVSAVGDVLVADRGIDAIYDVLGFMAGEPLMTHQLTAVSRAAEPIVAGQHPWLAELDPPRGDKAALKAWCAALVEERGAFVTLVRDPALPWNAGNAMRDLRDIAGDRPIIGGDA